jgi:hypothetical protein
MSITHLAKFDGFIASDGFLLELQEKHLTLSHAHNH